MELIPAVECARRTGGTALISTAAGSPSKVSMRVRERDVNLETTRVGVNQRFGSLAHTHAMTNIKPTRRFKVFLRIALSEPGDRSDMATSDESTAATIAL